MRKTVDYLRQFMRKNNTDVQNQLIQYYCHGGGVWKVTWWMNDKPLAKFKGPDLLVFVNEIPRIQSILLSHFPQDEQA